MSGLLRICTAGSVDDGKSTLIGRLLYESRGVYEDQVRSVEQASKHRGVGAIDFSLFTDGLKAEREQGITIDVAYRYFATARRKFILADTPGHEQYTRNMATGASTADVTILLVDARHGLRPQSERHARIARLLGIDHFVLAINKMDLVDYRRDVFDQIVADFRQLLHGARVQAIPLSALEGDNVTHASTRMPWYTGLPLLAHLESLHTDTQSLDAPFRFPVQLVLRPDDTFRGYAGRIASGTVRVGDRVQAWPSRRSSVVTRIVTHGGDLTVAHAPMSVTLTLNDELDISRGDLLAIGTPIAARSLTAHLVWMDERALDPSRVYRLKHTTRTTTAQVESSLVLNEIGTVRLTTAQPLLCDRYRDNRQTGCFVLIDAATNFTAGAGMIIDAQAGADDDSFWQARAERLVALSRGAESPADAIIAVRRALEGFLQ